MSIMSVKWIPVAAFLSLPLLAHKGDRIIPIYEITDEQIELIDIEDGSIAEWEDFGKPSLTTLDFSRFSYPSGENLDHDLSDFDFRIWLGWNGTHNRIYGSIQAADDSYRGFDNAIRVDEVSFYVDGDHSGGEFFFNDLHLNMQQAQTYSIYLETRDFLANDMWLATRDDCEWCAYPPYAEAGSGVFSENPVFWVIEFYVTPFDLLIWDDSDASVISSLDAGKVIGLSINVADSDTDGNEWDMHVFTVQDELWSADNFVDGLLVGKEGLVKDDSVVESVSWARIKASLNF